jgi:hypothetical protein
MMNENGISLADIAAVTRNNDDMGMNGIWNNPFVYLVWMFMARSFTGNGWGDNGGMPYGAATAAGQYATQADIQRAFDTNTITQKLDGITYGLSDGFYAVNTSNLQGFNGIQRDLCAGFNSVNNNIAENRFAAQQCCCETNRNIDNVRYENSKNTCDITNAIHAEGEATRALINANMVQDLRDRLEARDRDILARDFQLSQLAQNQTLINTLKPCPIPAYLTCSPYATANVVPATGCGCGANPGYTFG